MDDTISRQAAIDAIEQMQIPIMRSVFEYEQFIFKGMSEALNAVKELPSAQPEIIRCKDCKHWKIGTENLSCPNPAVCGLHSFMHRFERASLPEDYCSWAERRTDEIN